MLARGRSRRRSRIFFRRSILILPASPKTLVSASTNTYPASSRRLTAIAAATIAPAASNQDELPPLLARWGHNSVHTQVLDHLSVVVESVGGYAGRQSQPRNLPLSKRTLNQLHQVLVVDGLDGFVHIGKRRFQVADDFRLRFDRGRPR